MSSEEITKYEKKILLCDSAKLICFSKAYNVSPFEFLKRVNDKCISKN